MTALWGMEACIVISPTVLLLVDMVFVSLDNVNVILVGKGMTVTPHSVEQDLIKLDMFA